MTAPRPPASAGPGTPPFSFTVRPTTPTAGAVTAYLVRAVGAPRTAPPLAHAVAHAEPPGHPTVSRIDLAEGADGTPLCTVRPLGEHTWQVSAADGTSLALLEHRPGRLLPWPRRPRWTVRCDGDGTTLVGPVGTLHGWACCLAGWPLLLWAALQTGEDVDLRLRATRVTWRGTGPGAPAPLSRRGRRHRYTVEPSRLDARVAYAQAVLAEWYVLPARARRRLVRRAARRRGR